MNELVNVQVEDPELKQNTIEDPEIPGNLMIVKKSSESLKTNEIET